MTIAKVAQVAGVSTATVSRVINNKGNVSENAAQLVRDAMRKVGYSPLPPSRRPGPSASDPQARRKTDVLALVIPEVNSGYYPSLIKGFNDRAGSMHRQVIVCDTRNDETRQGDIVLQLIDKHVEGVAMVPAHSTQPPLHQFRQLREHGIPLVLIHRRVDQVRAPLIKLPIDKIIRMVTEKILAMGHRRLAFLGAVRGAVTERTMRQVVAEAGLPDDALTIIYQRSGSQDRSWPSYDTIVEEFFALPTWPTVVYCGFDPLAEYLYLRATRQGVQIPEDLSIVSFGGAQRDLGMLKYLTAATVDEVAVGEQAAMLLDQSIGGAATDADTTELEIAFSFYQGATLAAPSVAAQSR